VDTFVIYDWDDRDRLAGLKPIVEPAKRRAEAYRAMKPNPYFMRVDIETDGKGIKKYYIGEKSLIENNYYYIIHDWRDPILYEARFTRSKSFKVDKQICELYLRRAINIRNQQIENINTEFDSDALINLILSFIITPRHYSITNLNYCKLFSVNLRKTYIFWRPQGFAPTDFVSLENKKVFFLGKTPSPSASDFRHFLTHECVSTRSVFVY
jgi:hypothetical protein